MPKYIKVDIPLPYKITDNDEYTDIPFYTPPEILTEHEYIVTKLREGKNIKHLIPMLERLIKEYPDYPPLYSNLASAYSMTNKFEKGFEITQYAHKHFPEYIYAAANICTFFKSKKKYNEIPKALNNKLKIEEIAPNRKVFHKGEVEAFYTQILMYYLFTEKPDRAEEVYSILEAVDPKSDVVKKFRMPILATRGLKRIKKDKLERDSKPHVEYRSYNKEIQTEEEPVFNFPNTINNLNLQNFAEAPRFIETILQLPEKELIEDIETVINDGIRRYEYYSSQEGIFSYNLIHSTFLLAELKSEKSLDIFLELLQEGEELLRFWFGDMLSEDLWEVGLKLGKTQLDKLKDFMCEPGIYSSSKYCISISVQQLYLNEMIDKNTTVKWFSDIIEYHLNNPNTENLIDSSFLSLLLLTIKEMKLIDEFSEHIRKLYENDWILIHICGTQNELMTKRKYYYSNSRKKEIMNISDRYKFLRKQYNKTEEEKKEADKKLNDLYGKIQDGTIMDELDNLIKESNEPYNDTDNKNKSTPNSKVGRNDPCPCGSGKKYKKCCLK